MGYIISSDRARNWMSSQWPVTCDYSHEVWGNTMWHVWIPHAPLEDFTYRSVNSKQISLFGTSKCNIYSVCDKINLKIIQKMVAFENSHSPCGTLFQTLPQGCIYFKWSDPWSRGGHFHIMELRIRVNKNVEKGSDFCHRASSTFLEIRGQFSTTLTLRVSILNIVRQPNSGFWTNLVLFRYSLFFYWFGVLRPSILRNQLLRLCQHWAFWDINEKQNGCQNNRFWQKLLWRLIVFQNYNHSCVIIS